MTQKIIVVDFAGTLVKAEVIEEGNKLRSEILQRSLPKKEEHANPEELYKINREFVEKLTGLKSDVKIKYRKNDLGFMELTGEQVQNQISTNLFQIGMFMAAKKYGKESFQKGFVEELQRIKSMGYKLAIVSGIRTDIISGMLKIANCPVEFDYIYGQPPILGVENQEADVKELESYGTIEYSIGDKMSDLERVKAKTIFVKWGHASGREEEFADFTISSAEELKEIIK
ncbi:hypothetical protein KY308_01960 [Candidatus Woesearchaeota archaeon]|nr:hypothetical protein [Candidatus Woesearchaeota archaeon]